MRVVKGNGGYVGYTAPILRQRRLIKNFLWVSACGALFAVACRQPPPDPPANAPRLAVVIVVDQLRGDLLDRYDSLLVGGLRRLVDEGVVYTDAHHRHAVTTTAPGHATISTGCFPARHGIINNYWVDREGEEIYSASFEDRWGTPERLECPTLGDRLKQGYPASKVFAVAGKDRSAVLLGGKTADAAYWYDDSGAFESSEFYFEAEPPWVTSFREEDFLGRYFGTEWAPRSMPEEELTGRGVVPFDMGPLEPDFPHAFGGLALAPGEGFYGSLFTSPWLDQVTGKFAARLIESENLGADAYPDLLVIGFSALDAVGHRHGPDSPQVLDALMHLDETLETLFEQMDSSIGLENIVIALSSDHGAQPVPELRAAQGQPGARVGAADLLCVQSAEAELDRRFGEARWLRPGPFFDSQTIEDKGVDRGVLEQVVVEILEECSAVARVWTRTQLTATGTFDSADSDDPDGDPMLELYRHAFHPERSPDFLIQWREYFLPTRGAAASHGSPYRYDTWVPMIVKGPGIDPISIAEPAQTVDLAPTLAKLLGLEAPTDIDGRALDWVSPGN